MRAGRAWRPSLETLGVAGDYGSLAHYADPAYYEKAYARRHEDVEYYVRLAEGSAGDVLEFGVGSGRVALPIARAGRSVVGVDLSEPMLAAFRCRLRDEPREVQGRVRLVRGDMRAVRLRRRFPLVIAPFNTVLHLYSRQEVAQFLDCVRAHLAPGGRFVFDFCVPDLKTLAGDPTRRYGAPSFRDPATGQIVRYAERFEYDPMRQLLLVWMEFTPVAGGAPWTVPLTHRQFFPEEMASLLACNGFVDQTWFGDFRDEPPRRESDWLVVSCSAAPRVPGRRRRLAMGAKSGS
ncbi:MAG: class I SAM-dependent methyltransferase [Polyangiaceae bacterium]|nr:class I SAM-dependent methyltransferase [Polyangiaceae bacterium]